MGRTSFTRIFTRTAVGALGASLALTGAAAAQPADRTSDLITIGSFRPSVSPNGDGYHDRLRIPFTLAKAARVEAKVVDLDTGRVVRRSSCLSIDGLGCQLSAGTHVATWADLHLRYGPGPRYWKSGHYRVVLDATDSSGVADPDTGKLGHGRARTSFEYFSDALVVGSVKPRGTYGTAISPNGDHVQDRARVTFSLERRSRVTAVLERSNPSKTYRIRLGVHDEGRNAWVWNGRADGKVVPDADYDLDLRAVPVKGGPTSEAGARIAVDRTAPDPSITLNRSTVYPSATVINDSLRIGVDVAPEYVAAEIRKPNGNRLKRLAPAQHDCYWGDSVDGVDGPCTLLTWYAENAAGPVPAGAYKVRITVSDDAGNRTTTVKKVAVSTEQLVEHTGTVTWTASTAPGASDYCAGNYCGEVPRCAPVASERFAGGESFRSNAEDCRFWTPAQAFRHYGFTPDLPAGSTRFDRFRVTATGGPTTAGAADTGTVGIATSRSIAFHGDGPSATLAGDASVTTDWTTVRPDVELYPNDPSLNGNARMRWYAGAPGDGRYDIASYTLDYTYYAPAG
ncbi:MULTISPECIES: hypothetical protein [unclassified Nocardioides]|uniref:hypothetical protein n=1 Tax=unclassified Nocardioides TaxID=2615069 RepID=UPI00361A88A3